MPPFGAYLYLDAGQNYDPYNAWGWIYYNPDIALCRRVWNVLQPEYYDKGAILILKTADELDDLWIVADEQIEYLKSEDSGSDSVEFRRALEIATALEIGSIGGDGGLLASGCVIAFERVDEQTGFVAVARCEDPAIGRAVVLYLQRRYGSVEETDFRLIEPREIGLWLLATEQSDEAFELFEEYIAQTKYFAGQGFPGVDTEDYLGVTKSELDEITSPRLKYHIAANQTIERLLELPLNERKRLLGGVTSGALDPSSMRTPDPAERDVATDPTLETQRQLIDPSTCSHADDFLWVNWFGTRYTFSKGHQSICVRELWKEWEKAGKGDGCGLSEKTLGVKCESSSDQFRVSQTFRGHPAYGTMIRASSKGTFALFSPKSPENPTS